MVNGVAFSTEKLSLDCKSLENLESLGGLLVALKEASCNCMSLRGFPAEGRCAGMVGGPS